MNKIKESVEEIGDESAAKAAREKEKFQRFVLESILKSRLENNRS